MKRKTKQSSEIKLLKIDDLNHENSNAHFYANLISKHLISNHSRIETHHKHNFYAVFLFTRGTGMHEIDFNRYEVKPGAVFFLTPGQTHCWDLSPDTVGFLFFHSREFYETYNIQTLLKDFVFFESFQTEKCFYLKNNELEKIEHFFVDILNEYQLSSWKKNQLINSYLTQVYIWLNRFVSTKSLLNFDELKRYQTIYTGFENLLESNFLVIRNAGQYADMLNITQKHLNRVVKSITGKTTTSVVAERVVLEAKRELIFAQKTVGEIANDLNFSDVSYFIKFFKKYTQETPAEFARRNLNTES